MRLIAKRCEVCGTKLGRRSGACGDCERTARHASLLELYAQFDDREAASRRAERMSAAITRVAAQGKDSSGLASALEASLRAKLAAAA